MMQFLITPAAGKRLIARAIARHDAVRSALESGTTIIVAGTTNGYVAEEILSSLGQSEGFRRERFMRGVALPAAGATTEEGRIPDESEFPGDVVIVKGQWQRGRTIFDAVDELRAGDVILKGANAIDPRKMQAGVLIGHPKGGTIVAALQAVVGRRVRLILPVGLEKRVSSDIYDLAAMLNSPEAKGPRLLPVTGEVVTEIEALNLLAGVDAELVAAGGVSGGEGSIRLAISGSPEAEKAAEAVMASVENEPPFTL